MRPDKTSRSILISIGIITLAGALIFIVLGRNHQAKALAPATQAMLESQIGQRIELTRAEREYLENLGELRICVDPDWVPYEWIDGDGVYRGIAAELVDLMGKRLNIEINLVRTKDWKESIETIKAGKAHLLAFLNQTPERDEWLVFTEPYFTDPNVFITREDHGFIVDPERLSGETIVFPAGTSMEERIRSRYPSLAVLTVETEGEALRAVMDRNADMTLRSLTMAAYTIRKEGLFSLKIAGQLPEMTNSFRMGVAKGYVPLRDILNKAVATITPQDVQAAVNRHISIEVRSEIDYLLLLRAAGLFAVLLAFGLYWNFRLGRLNRKLKAREAELMALSVRLEEDVKARIRLEAKLQAEAEHLRLIIDTVPAYIYAKDSDGRFILANKAMANLFGVAPEEAIGRTNRDYGATEEQTALYRQQDREVLQTGKAMFIPEEESMRPDRTPGWFQTTKIPYRHPEGDTPAILGVSIDITERRANDERIRYMAQHDGLTGLPNRALFADRLSQALALARRNSSRVVVFFIDLDGFKPVNDTHGHAVGDLVLQETARRLLASVRSSDCVGRIGGDEFVLFIQDAATPDDATLVADKIYSSIRLPYLHQDLSLHLSASVGFAQYPEDGTDENALFQKADAAMYEAKRLAKGR